MNIFNDDENLQRRYADALKTSIDKTFGIEMNNEPVAWMYQDDEGRSVAVYRDTLPCGAIPLYTHPVKELSDEEIVDIWGCAEYMIDYSAENGIKFARAILRKAQEK